MASWAPGPGGDHDDSEQSEEYSYSDWELFSQWGTATTEWWLESQESQSQEDSVRPTFRGKEGKWRLFNIEAKKERLKNEKVKERVTGHLAVLGSTRIKEKIRLEQEEKKEDLQTMKKVMEEEMKKFEDRNEQERKDASESMLESQSLLASKRRWH